MDGPLKLLSPEDFSSGLSIISRSEIDRADRYVAQSGNADVCINAEVDVWNEFASLLDKFRRATSFQERKDAFAGMNAFVARAQSGLNSFKVVNLIVAKFMSMAELDLEQDGKRPIKFHFTEASGRQYNLAGGVIAIAVRINAEEGICPPAENILVRFVYGNNGIGHPPYRLREFCSGDEKLLPSFDIAVSEEDIERGGGVVKASIEYDGYDGVRRHEGDFDISFKIAYVEVEDVYKTWIDHEADSSIFVGRRELLGRMIRIATKPFGGLGFPISGQRRWGKSSLLKAFGQAVDNNGSVFCTMLSFWGDDDYIGAGIGYETPSDLFATRIGKSLVDSKLLAKEWIDADQFKAANALEKIAGFRKLIPDGKTWCVCVDEFTAVYDYYRRDPNARREDLKVFFKLLKRLVGDRVFHLFVVVQNSIWKLKSEFPEIVGSLGVVEKLGGLSAGEIGELVDKIDGNHRRIRAPELEYLEALSGGCPLFVLHLLSACVRSMTKDMKSYMITKPVIKNALSWLCRPKKNGKENECCMKASDFQCLFKLGIPEVSDENLQLLHAYRVLSGVKAENGDNELDSTVMNALEDRFIVDRTGQDGAYSLRIGLFKEWLRENDKDGRLEVSDFIGEG